MEKFKNNLIANITLIVSLVCSITHLIILTVNIFKEKPAMFYDGFSYLVAYILIIVSLLLYMLFFYISRIGNFKVPSWFESVFYVAFFIFTNTFYITNAYSSIAAIIFLFAYISLLSTIVNVSVFYNVQKDEKNRLVASKNYIVTSIFFYSVGTNAIIELLVTIVKTFICPNYIFSTLTCFIIESCTMLLVTIAMCVLFYLSLSKSKKFINNCLIKFNKPE